MHSPLYLYASPHLLFSHELRQLKPVLNLLVHNPQLCSRARQVQTLMLDLNQYTGLPPRRGRMICPTSSWQCASSAKVSSAPGDATSLHSARTYSSSKPASSLGNGSLTSPHFAIFST